jgi:WD40 repeat protein
MELLNSHQDKMSLVKLKFSICLVIVLLITSCVPANQQSTNIAGTDTPTIALSPTPANTSTVTPTPTATPVPIPLPDGVIMRLGNGTINTIAFSPDDKDLVIGTSIGVYLYDVASFTLKNFINADSPLTVISVSADGKKIAGGSYSDSSKGIVFLWDSQSGELLETINGFTSSITSLAISPDGKKLASGLSDGLIVVTDIPSNSQMFQANAYSGRVNGIAFSPNGSLISAGYGQKRGQGCTVLWDSETGQQVNRLNSTSGPVIGVTFSPDGQTLASQSHEGQLILLDTNTYKNLNSTLGEIPRLSIVSFSSDGKTIRYVNGSSSIVEKKTEDLSLVNDYGIIEELTSHITFSTNGKYYASELTDGSVTIIDLAIGEKLNTVGGFYKAFWGDLFFSSNGKLMAASYPNERIIVVFDLLTGREIHQISEGLPDDWNKRVKNIKFSEDLLNLTGQTGDGSSITWELNTGEIIGTVPGFHSDEDYHQSAAFSPDGSRLAIGNDSGFVDIRDVKSRGILSTINSMDEMFLNFCPSFSSDSNQFIYLDWQSINIVEVSTGEVIKSFSSNEPAQLTCSAITPDGKYIAAGDLLGNVILWDTTTGEELKNVNLESRIVSNFTFSPDGQILAVFLQGKDVYSGFDVFLLDSKTGEIVKIFSTVDWYAFSPDSKTIAILSGGTIMLYPVR